MLRNVIFALFFLVLSLSVSAQEIKITSSPNPVGVGTNVRIAVQTEFVLENPTVVFLNKTLPLQKVGKNVYTTSFLVPTGTKAGIVQAQLNFTSASGKGLKIPFQFEVVLPQTARVGNQIESDGTSFKTNPLQEANIKIDQLEDSVKKLQSDRERLKKQIDTAKKELTALKATPRVTSAQLTQKEDELSKLEKSLENREKTLRNQEVQYQKQLEDLIARETAIGEKEKALREREETLAKERSAIATQAKELAQQQDNLQKQSVELSKRQKEADIQEVNVRSQSQELKQLQDQLNRNAQLAANQKKLLEEKEKDLELLRKQVGDQDSAVQSRTRELQAEQKALDQRNSDLKTLSSQVQAQKRLVADAETALKRRMQDVDTLAVKLESDRKALDERQSGIQARESSLKIAEDTLQVQRNALSVRDEQLKLIEKTLREEELALKEQKSLLASQQQELSKKESDLEKIQTDIAQKNASLERLMQDVELDRVTLTSQAASVRAEKESLQTQQKNLVQDKVQLQSQQDKLQAQEASLKRRREIVEKELASAKSLQDQDRAQLEQQRRDLDALDLSLREAKQRFAAISAEQAQRERALAQAEQNQLARERALALQMKELESKEAGIELLRKDVYDKYMALDELKSWVDKRTYELQEAYARAQEDKMVSTAAFQEQFQKLERLTRMLQHRTRSLMEMNKSLSQQNQALELEIQTTVPTESQFTIAPYLGYRAFSSSEFKSAPNAGLKLMGAFSRDWGFDTAIGFVPTLENEKSKLVYTMEFLFSRHMMSWNKFRLFGLLGLGGRIGSTATVGMSGGLSVRNPLSEDTAADLDIVYGPDFVVRLGLDMKLRFDQKPPSTSKVVVAANPLPETEGTIDVLLRVPSSREQTKVSRPVLRDVVSHWSEADASLAAAFGLLELTPIVGEKNTYLFFPNKQVSLLEGLKMITRATYLPKMVSDESLPIAFTIVDLPGVEYLVTVWIEDELGQPVRTIFKGERRGVGDFSTQWDGLTDAGARVPAGKYVVKVALFDQVSNQKVIAKQSEVTVLDRASFNWNWASSREVVFTDIPPSYPDRGVINAWMGLGNSPVVIKNRDDVDAYGQPVSLFEPSQTMTRISFIVSLSKSLGYLGAKSYSIPDVSPYSDINTLPKGVQDSIGLYISALNYGGDDQRRLRLYEPITRAEAVTILSRFLKWQSKEFNFPLP